MKYLMVAILLLSIGLPSLAGADSAYCSGVLEQEINTSYNFEQSLAISLSGDGQTLAIGGQRNLYLVDSETMALERQISPPNIDTSFWGFYALDWVEDNKRLIARYVSRDLSIDESELGSDHHIVAIDVETEVYTHFDRPQRLEQIGLGSLVASHDGSIAAYTAAHDNQLYVWDISSGEILLEYQTEITGPPNAWRPIFSAWHPTRSLLALMDGSPTVIRIFDFGNPNEIVEINAIETSVGPNGISWSTNNNLAIFGGLITLWDPFTTGTEPYQVLEARPGSGVAHLIAWSPSGRYIARIGETSRQQWINIRNVITDEDVVLEFNEGVFLEFEWSPDEAYVYTLDTDGSRRLNSSVQKWSIADRCIVGEIRMD